MKVLIKYLFVLALFCSLELRGQEKSDTAINALEHSLQKRYRFAGERFQAPKWYENTFVSIYAGTGQVAPNANGVYSVGPVAGVSLGKWFDESNGMRLSASSRSYMWNVLGEKSGSWGVEASHLYNLTSNITGLGSRPMLCELYLVSGAGVGSLSTDYDRSKFNVGLHIGLNVNLNLFRYLAFYMEPMGRCNFAVLRNNLPKKRSDNDWGYDMTFGLIYNFIGREYERYMPDYAGGYFISLMGGAQFDVLNNKNHNIGYLESFGPHGAFSFGKCYNDLFALRSSLFYSNVTWTKYINHDTYKTHYFGFRLEGMFEFLHYVNEGKLPLRLSLLFGPEVGGMHKTDLNETIFVPYMGLSAGVQLKAKVSKHLALFLEPRCSLVPYVYKTSVLLDSTDSLTNYHDFVTNFNFGFEIGF